MRQRIFRDTFEFILYWLSTAGHGLPLRVVHFPCKTPFGETNFSFASGYQLVITSGLGMGWGPVSIFLLNTGTLCGTGPVHAASHSVYQSCLEGLVSLGSTSPLSLELWPPPFLQSSLCWERKYLMGTSHLELGVTGTLSSCGSLCLSAPAARGSFYDAGWARHWSWGKQTIAKSHFIDESL